MAGRNPIGGLGRALFGNVGKDVADALGRKIGALPDANAVPSSRSFVEGYEGNQVLPKIGGQDGGDVDPQYVYRTMSKKEYEDLLSRGELVNPSGRTHASAAPLSEFSNNVDDTVTVKIKYDRGDGWKAKSSLDEVYAVTDQPISSKKIEIVGALPTAPVMPKLKVDNPGGDWLQSKLQYAQEAREGAKPNTYRSTLGTGEGVTGYFREPVYINPNILTNIRGSLGEELYRPDPAKIDRLRKSIAEDGYDEKSGTVLIQVREDGVPFVVEGNHRIIEAAESGRQAIPVEIKYLRGAEDVDGPLSPAALGAER